MDIFLRPWRHYADFSGRSSRTEYWVFHFVYYGVLMLVAFPFYTGEADSNAIVLIPFGIWFLAGIVPLWAVAVRRIHDFDKSGHMVLLTLIPYVGPLIALVFGFWPGTPGENDYGWDPRHPEPADTSHMEQIFS